MNRLTFHLLGLAHIKTTKENSACAYTQKIIKLADMIKSRGHKIYFYGVEGSSVNCDEFISVVDEDVLRKTYGDYDKSRNFFKHSPTDASYKTFNENAIREINERKSERDILLCTLGNYQKPIADAVNLMTVEPGIGYTGVFCANKVFESYAWMHYVYGLMHIENGQWYDAVIPNYFDVSDYPFNDKKEDYLLYFGRIIGRKGVALASEIAKATGNRLYIVGQGSLDNDEEGLHLGSEKHIVYKPAVGPRERAEIMGKAKAVIMPTYYIEPFGGVNVEAQLMGTPVITTDWGAFPETVLHGVTGYRCRTFEEFCWAVKNIYRIKSENCRVWAEKNYSMERVAGMYEEYFQRINRLFASGWYEENPDRRELSWLEKYYV